MALKKPPWKCKKSLDRSIWQVGSGRCSSSATMGCWPRGIDTAETWKDAEFAPYPCLTKLFICMKISQDSDFQVKNGEKWWSVIRWSVHLIAFPLRPGVRAASRAGAIFIVGGCDHPEISGKLLEVKEGRRNQYWSHVESKLTEIEEFEWDFGWEDCAFKAG